MASTVNSSGGAKSQCQNLTILRKIPWHVFVLLTAMDGEYVSQACRTLMQCLRLLAFGLRAAVLAKLEEGTEEYTRRDVSLVPRLTDFFSSP